MTVKSWMYFAIEYQEYVQNCEANEQFYCLEQWLEERDGGSEEEPTPEVEEEERNGKNLFLTKKDFFIDEDASLSGCVVAPRFMWPGPKPYRAL